ncbi:MAG: hypothetical protein LEGION0403_FIIPPAGN_02871 [Legionella sp.]|uniref:pentapeptide repeat-containing protein n=1 Tax=Legionella sp. TaxID=459 RepID=UPI003D0F242A
MKKTILTASFIGIICSSFQSYAYIPADVSRFKNDTDCIRCNLTGSSFSSGWEKIEKSGGTFDGTFFTNFTLSGYKIIDSSFVDTNFVKSTLQNNELTNSIFQKANFSHSHLSNVKFIRSTFKDVNFAHASMDGTWSSCSFNKVDFTDSDLEGASFPKTKMIDVNFSGAKLKNADLSRVNVENLSFDNADLSYAVLMGSNITEEQLSKAKTYKCATLPNGDVYTNNGEFNCK